MKWTYYQARFSGYAEVDRKNPVDMGFLLLDVEQDFPSDFEDRITQLVSYFPQKKQQTVANLRSICRGYDKEKLPKNVRISQMDACRGAPQDKRMIYLEWACSNDFGRDEILKRLEEDGYREAKQIELDKTYQKAITILDKLISICPTEWKAHIQLAKSALLDATKERK